MLCSENTDQIKELLVKINYHYDVFNSLVSHLSDCDSIPGCSATKLEINIGYSEFKQRTQQQFDSLYSKPPKLKQLHSSFVSKNLRAPFVNFRQTSSLSLPGFSQSTRQFITTMSYFNQPVEYFNQILISMQNVISYSYKLHREKSNVITVTKCSYFQLLVVWNKSF